MDITPFYCTKISNGIVRGKTTWSESTKNQIFGATCVKPTDPFSTRKYV